MAKPERRGGLQGVDPAVQQFMRGAATNPAALTPKQRRDRKRLRTIFDIEPELKAAIEHIADQESTSASQVAAMLMAYAARSYAVGNDAIRAAFHQDRTPARTPRFEWMIAVPDEWLTEIAAFAANGNVKR